MGVGAFSGGVAAVVFGPATAASAASDSVMTVTSASARTDAVCDAAVAVIKAGGDDALRIAVEMLQKAQTSSSDIAVCLTPAKANPEYTEVSLGALWKLFTKDIDALVPILVFVGLSALALLVIARLLALVPMLRNPRSMRGWRRFAWTVGLLLAFIVPAMIALRGMWVIAQGGPDGYEDVDDPEYGFGRFIDAVFSRSGFWWLLMLLVVLTIATLTFAFATRQGVTIKLKAKDDGKSLDTAHIMAAMDGMAGRTNRGLEFPVGTDLTTAAGAVSELSDNKFVAALQVAVSAILGSTPWQLVVENEGEKAASVTISRNGALMKAKRIKIGEMLTGVTELTSAELLAALIGGELIATLRSKYRSEFDADLSGATDGESIALHFIAGSALGATRDARGRGIPILARAVELDPQNRAAWTTLANFAYRDPTFHDEKNALPHVAYRDFLDRAIVDELTRGRNNWDRVYAWGGPPQPATTLRAAQLGIRKRRMRRNGLLARLLQTRMVASVNAGAINPRYRDGDREYQDLRRQIYGGPLTRREPPKTAIRRRQLLLIDEFREHGNPLAGPPAALHERAFRRECRAWTVAAETADPRPEAMRVACENAVLAVSGDFAHDPIVAYALASYRADRRFGRTGGSR